MPPAGEPLARQAEDALRALGNARKAQFLATYFKTGKGQYGEGDAFLGVTVPQVRQQVRHFRQMSLPGCAELLQSPYNELRLLALLVMVHQFEKGDEATQKAVYDCFMEHRDRVNNWNLVDSSAPFISGPYLLHRSRKILYTLAKSPLLWDRRIAVLSTFAMIRAGEFADTLKLCETLMGDREDLMHKACGWMLREMGSRDIRVLQAFVREHQLAMPRTMLRYAIEKFPPEQRKAVLAGSF